MILTEINNSKSFFSFSAKTPEQRVIWEVIFLLPIIITVGFCGVLAQDQTFGYLYTWIMTIVFSITLIVRFIVVNEKGDWIFFLLGVLAGGGNDLMSMANGVYDYTSMAILPFLNGLMPLWMILFWGQVFLVFRKVFHLNWFKGEEFQKTRPGLSGWVNKQLIIDLILLVCLRFVIYNTFMDPLLPAAIYAGVILLRFVIFHPKKNELLIIAILPYAFIFEGLMVKFGLYIYWHDHLLGMPLWLLLWWIFLVPIVLKEIFDRLEYYLKNK